MSTKKAPRLDLFGNPIKIEICELCGMRRGDHKAGTLNCQIGKSRGNFASFHKDQTYKEKR